MISNQILQTNIEGLKGITRVDLCICDTEGKVRCPPESLRKPELHSHIPQRQ